MVSQKAGVASPKTSAVARIFLNFIKFLHIYVKIITKQFDLVKQGEDKVLIGENLHIISKRTKEAIAQRDANYVLTNIENQTKNGVNVVDLNIGPAKGAAQGSLKWLLELLQDKFKINYSLDTTNINEMREGFDCLDNPQDAFLNSTSADDDKLKNTTEIVAKYDSNLIALTMSAKTGIPKTPEERIELAFNILENTSAFGIKNSKLWLDPLILPVCAAQEQVLVSLDTIRMLKESFEPKVNTLVGLSNISNGCPKELRADINRTFLVLALGCGLDGAIIDAFDTRTINIYNVIKNNKPCNKVDEIYIKLYESMRDFTDIDEIKYDKSDNEQHKIIRCAQILLNREIYSHSFV